MNGTRGKMQKVFMRLGGLFRSAGMSPYRGVKKRKKRPGHHSEPEAKKRNHMEVETRAPHHTNGRKERFSDKPPCEGGLCLRKEKS